MKSARSLVGARGKPASVESDTHTLHAGGRASGQGTSQRHNACEQRPHVPDALTLSFADTAEASDAAGDGREQQHAAAATERTRKVSWHPPSTLVETRAYVVAPRLAGEGAEPLLDAVDARRIGLTKMNRHEYADAVDEVTTTRIDVSKAASLPHVCAEDLADELEEVDAWLDRPELPEHDADESAPAKRGDGASSVRVQPEKEQRMLRLCDGTTIAVTTTEPRGWCGDEVRAPNSFWPYDEAHNDWDPLGWTWCTIAGKCVQPYKFSSGPAASSYVLYSGDDDEYYPMKESAVAKLTRREAPNKKKKKKQRR